MSDSKMKLKMKLFSSQYINNNSSYKKSLERSLINEFSPTIKLGFTGLQRNYKSLKIQGDKHCKSCSDKK